MQAFNLATKFRACYCTYFPVWACARFASDLFVEVRRGFSCFCASNGFVWWQVFYIRYCWNKSKWYLHIRICISISFQLCLWINAMNWEVSLTHPLPLNTVHSILSWECLDFSGLDGVVFLPYCCAYPAWFAPSWKQLIQGVWSLYALLNLPNIKFGVHLFPVKKFSGEFSRKFQVYGWDESVKQLVPMLKFALLETHKLQLNARLQGILILLKSPKCPWLFTLPHHECQWIWKTHQWNLRH